jgi:hypothetical protein
MGLFLTLITGLVVWIVLWAPGLMKSFDAFLIGMFLVLLAAGTRILLPYLPGRKD